MTGKRDQSISILELLLGDEDALVRMQVIENLSKIKDARALDLMKRALKDNDDSVRCHAAMFIGLRKDKRALDALTEMAANEPDCIARQVAEGAIELIKGGVDGKNI